MKAILMATLAIAVTASGCAREKTAWRRASREDERGVIEILEAYRMAAERRDPSAVLALVSQSYFDDAGTPDPVDDLDRDQLARELPLTYARLPSLHLHFEIKRLEVERNTARVDVLYDSTFRLKSGTGRHEIDDHRIVLRKEGGAWRIQSGL